MKARRAVLVDLARLALIVSFSVALTACREVDVIDDDGSGSTGATSSVATTGAATSASSSSGGSTCSGDACDYTAMSLVTGAPRMALLKMDKVRDLCFQLVMVAGATQEIVFDGSANVENARVTNEADDCIPWGAGFPPEPIGDVVDASGLIGTLSIALGNPCVVDVDAAMTFANAPPWVPESEALIASDLQMINGCP